MERNKFEEFEKINLRRNQIKIFKKQYLKQIIRLETEERKENSLREVVEK